MSNVAHAAFSSHLVSATPAPSTPRLRLGPVSSRTTLLDGGWWPRSTDPLAELPGLIVAIAGVHGPVLSLVLSDSGWDSHPARIEAGGRVVRLGFFTSQAPDLLTAVCDNESRVDLMVIAPATPRDTAEKAMAVAATGGNLAHIAFVGAAPAEGRSVPATAISGLREQVWETDGGSAYVTGRRSLSLGNGPGTLA